MKYCGKCGAPLREGKGLCPKCGAEVRRPEPVQEPAAPVAVKEKCPRRGARRLVTALIVLVLIGGLGAAGWYWGLPYVKGLLPAGELPRVSYSYMSREPEIEIEYEAVDAIDLDDPELMCEELGDVLMQVAFHAVMEEERGHFTFEDVCREVCEKLVFRHPNIFASSAAQNAGINGWDALKNKEKGRTTLADELGTVPTTLPALMRAQKLQKRADRCGAAQPDKTRAQQALQDALDGWSREQDARTAGELLFAAANAMRLAGVDAEEALTFASKRFCAGLLEQEPQSGTQVE